MLMTKNAEDEISPYGHIWSEQSKHIFPLIQMIQNTLEKICPSRRYNISGGTLSLLQSGDIPAPQYQGREGLRR